MNAGSVFEQKARDDWLKVECKNCHHSRGWHFPILPSNVPLSVVKSYGIGECNHSPCECKRFMEPESRR